jgi:hypothetical protein
MREIENLSPRERQVRTQLYTAIILELLGTCGVMLTVALYAPWHAALWAPSGWLVYLAFAYRRWMHL